MKTFLAVVLCLSVWLCRCDAILNGKKAQHGQFKYQVSIRDAETRHLCNGAVVAASWVITAAQCTQGSSAEPNNLRIVVGTIYSDQDGGKEYQLERIVNHPRFNWTRRQNDVTLLMTKEPMDISHLSVFPVRFPTFEADYSLEKGLESFVGTISGWGPAEVRLKLIFS